MKRAQPEADHCKALTKWRNLAQNTRPELKWLFHIPSGGRRDPRTAAYMKAEGARSGVWDFNLPVARDGSHGLWLEMKAPGREKEKDGGLSEEQVKFGLFVIAQGYKAIICYDWSVARQMILDYLGEP